MARENKVFRNILSHSQKGISNLTFILICLAIFLVILVIFLVISITLLRKQKNKSSQAEVDQIYADNFVSENQNEECNDYELVDYDQIPDEQEYLEIQETEFD